MKHVTSRLSAPPGPPVSFSRRNSSPSSSSAGLLRGLPAQEAGVAGEEEEEGGGEEEGERTWPRRGPRPPPAERKPASHWLGRRCPSHASPRGGRGRRVTGVTGEHREGCGDDDEGGSSGTWTVVKVQRKKSWREVKKNK